MSGPTPAEIEAGMEAATVCGCSAGRKREVVTQVLAAVLPDHDARVRADERAKVAEQIARQHATREEPAGGIMEPMTSHTPTPEPDQPEAVIVDPGPLLLGGNLASWAMAEHDPATVELVAEALWAPLDADGDRSWAEFAADAPRAARMYRRQARAVLDALTAAGWVDAHRDREE